MSKHLELLGKKCEEVVTGVTGVVTMVSFDLYGCIQAAVEMKHKKGEDPRESKWYDIGRLTAGVEVIGFISPDDINSNLICLGCRSVDVVTGLKGVITSILVYTNGSVQYLLTPKAGKDGLTCKGNWFTSDRVSVKCTTPVLDQPDFINGPAADGNKGPSEKPAMQQAPIN